MAGCLGLLVYDALYTFRYVNAFGFALDLRRNRLQFPIKVIPQFFLLLKRPDYLSRYSLLDAKI